jgi:peptide/nickel transport system substrate-binding protein
MTVIFNAAKKPFDDSRVRQALNYAVNVDEIIQFVMSGAGYRLASATKPGMLGFDPDLKPYPYDPDKAKQLLAEAGYPNGFEATLDGPASRYINDKAVSEAIVGQLNKIGLRITPNVVEWNNFVQKVIKQESQFFLIAQPDPTTEIAFPRTYFPGGALYQNYQNKDVADLIQRGNRTLDRAERDKIFREANQVLYNDPPWLFLYAQQDVYGLRSRLQGFQPRTDSYIIPGPLSVGA